MTRTLITSRILPLRVIGWIAEGYVLRLAHNAEATWTVVRTAEGALPRVVNWITGPSRTADIEQTLLIGIHGPHRQHIVLIDDQST